MPDDAGFGAQFSKARPQPIWADDAAWDEAQIPQRPWIAPGYFLRGAVTVAIGAGGVSKSALMLAYGTALALGRPLGNMEPTAAFRVALYNVEDDADEQRRRLSAILTSMGSTPGAISGRLKRIGPNGVGVLLQRDPESRDLFPTEAWTSLVEELRQFGPDVLILDPFVELHTDDENANVAVREVIARFRALAIEYQLALVLIHHTRKGVIVPGDMDQARGASAIAGAARVVLTIVGMTEDEGKAFDLPPGHRRHFFRVDGAKSNYAPLTDAEWFERTTYALANGDFVAAPVEWQPPKETITVETRALIETEVARGSGAGPWSGKLSDDARSIKHLLEQHGVRTKPGQKQAITQLLGAGFVLAQFKKPGNRNPAQGFRAPSGEPTNVQWIDDTDLPEPPGGRAA